MVVDQYDIYLINLDPTVGHEIKKTRPCVIISPNELNHNIDTVMIAPMTTGGKNYPSRVAVRFQRKDGFIVLDQLRTIDKRRLVRRLGRIAHQTIPQIKDTLAEMLVR
jgi:mRNA interferase MazF